MERIPNGSGASGNRVVFFVAVDVVDLFTRETGLSSFTVDYVLDNGARAQMTSPTTAAIDDTNLPGLYSLLIDEAGMTNMDAANDSETLVLQIEHASMSPVTMKVEVYRPQITATRTLAVDASGRIDVGQWLGTAVTTNGSSNKPQVDVAAVGGATPMSLDDINAEVDTALDTAIPGTPTADSINERVAAIDDLTQASGGGDLVAILGDTNAIQGKLPTNKFMGSSDGADDDGTLNTINTNAARLTAVRAAVLTDLIDGGRLDLLIDAILEDTGTTLDGKINTIDTVVDAIFVDVDAMSAGGSAPSLE